MPRFFFDLQDGETLKTDEEGLDLAGPDEARRTAMVTLPEIARDLASTGNQELVATVRDEQGALFRVSLSLRCEPL